MVTQITNGLSGFWITLNFGQGHIHFWPCITQSPCSNCPGFTLTKGQGHNNIFWAVPSFTLALGQGQLAWPLAWGQGHTVTLPERSLVLALTLHCPGGCWQILELNMVSSSRCLVGILFMTYAVSWSNRGYMVTLSAGRVPWNLKHWRSSISQIKWSLEI